MSILTVFGWLSFILLFVAFWATDFTGLQTVVIILVSLFAFMGINGAVWASWANRDRIPS